MKNSMRPYVLALSGASAQQIGIRALKYLLLNDRKVHLVLSKGAYEVWQSENNTKIPVDSDKQEAYWRNLLNIDKGILTCHKWNNQSACIASGSYKTKGMLIVPCSMGLVGRIASGSALDLIERTADVHIKEGRKIVISPREMPWSLIHLRNLTLLAEAGVKIAPPIPAWYTKPESIDDIINFIVARLFDSFDEDFLPEKRWKGT